MFAIVKSGGKQFKVKSGCFFDTEKCIGEEGSEIILSEVLLVSDGINTFVGDKIKSAKVKCELIKTERHEKVIIFKKRKRQNSRRKNGHRQFFSRLKVLSIDI